MTARIQVPADRIAEFCQRWKIVEFSLFGSVLRDDFRPDSDVDVLVTFASDSRRKLLNLAQMRDELHEIFGRDIGISGNTILV